MDPMELTSDLESFLKLLRPGDVLVYDSLSSISKLVQWADDSPANHVSVMYDTTRTAMANTPHGLRHPEQIQLWTAEAFLGRRFVRGVVLLRHPVLADGDSWIDDLQRRIDVYRASTAKFSLVDLVAMAPAALVRAYQERGFNFPDPEDEKQVLKWLMRLRARLLKKIPDDKLRVFCSEFVYRCLMEAGLHVEIDDPIRDPAQLTSGTEGGLWGDDELLSTEQAFWAELRKPPDPPIAIEGMKDAFDFPVRPDLVVPGDFWCSPTFERVAHFVKTPPTDRDEINVAETEDEIGP